MTTYGSYAVANLVDVHVGEESGGAAPRDGRPASRMTRQDDESGGPSRAHRRAAAPAHPDPVEVSTVCAHPTHRVARG
jgi:hypothetical protein